MLLKNCMYLIIVVISLLSIPIIIYSIKNKNKGICKSIKTINIFYIIYLILNIVVIPNVLRIDTGLEFLLLVLIAFIAIIIYIISIIICSKKIKKDKVSFTRKSILVMLVLIVLPILLFSYSLLREYYLITNSDIVIVYKSNGNGGFGDSKNLAYAINDNYIKEISLGIAIGDYSLERYLPKKAQKIDDIENIDNYKVSLNEEENYIIIYKDNKLIHKEQINPDYYNITFDGGFYINHD